MSDFLMKVVKCLDQIKAQGLSNLEYDGKKLKWRNDFAELKKFLKKKHGASYSRLFIQYNCIKLYKCVNNVILKV
jgi:hypothetical protein